MRYYRQCRLENCNQVQMVWIPEERAKLASYLHLGKSEALWLVTWVSDERQPEKRVMDYERDYLHQREASDI